MWLTGRALVRYIRRPFAELDYARHMPEDYVRKAKREVPRKIYDNRFGAPPVIRWFLPPGDYVPSEGRPWETAAIANTSRREANYHQKKLQQKFFQKRHKAFEQIPDEKWTMFPGDFVEVMVGKDKGKQGVVQKVIRESNSVYVEGLNAILKNEFGNKRLGMDDMYRWVEQPLDVAKNQVKLVDPNTNEACDAEWVLKGEYMRVSVQSGYEIPIPSQAYVTYEYLSTGNYVECVEKDTPSDAALEKTYVPKLSSFEEELMQEMGIHDDRVPKPTYWY